jgi:hypothetical protein
LDIVGFIYSDLSIYSLLFLAFPILGSGTGNEMKKIKNTFLFGWMLKIAFNGRSPKADFSVWGDLVRFLEASST